MAVNADLLLKTLQKIEEIEASPTKADKDGNIWDQQTWRTQMDCGTAMCFAGWACAFEGVEFTEAPGYYDDYNWYVLDPNNKVTRISIEDHAQSILGLDCDRADSLFYYDNTLEDLRRIVTEIIDGE